MKPRDLALAALSTPSSGPAHPERCLEHHFRREPGLSRRDRALAVHLVQGVLRWQGRLDWIIRQNIQFPFTKIDPRILAILRIALYQIYFMDRVPESAAVDEAVKQAKERGPAHVAKFVNGILRHVCRNKDQVPFPDREAHPVEFLAAFYSYPEWLVRRWVDDFGTGSAERLMDAGNRIPTLTIRTNTLRTDRGSLTRELTAAGLPCRATQYAPNGIEVVKTTSSIDQVETFRKGWFQVQGEAAQICSHLLQPKAGETVLDLCAGLGGKSTHLAELMGDTGRVAALDINHDRLVSLLRTTGRLGIRSVFPVVADAAEGRGSLFRRKFDRVLIDAPCSALGVISRHPDVKWTKGEVDIQRLATLQKRILTRAVSLLKKGGQALYATCTMTREENEDVVQEVLERDPQMRLENIRDGAPPWAEHLIDENGFYRALPHEHGIEGFFGALLTRKGG